VVDKQALQLSALLQINLIYFLIEKFFPSPNLFGLIVSVPFRHVIGSDLDRDFTTDEFGGLSVRG
jgi:hypothetical protein